MRSILLLFLLALTPSCLIAQQQTPVPSHAAQAQFSFDTDREDLISLKGKWRFQPGDNPAFASPTFDDSQWQLIDSDRMWPAQLYHDKSGLAWYRFRVILPPGSEPMALYLPPIHNCYQVFADGTLLLSVGHMPPNAAPYDTNPMLIPLSAVSRPEQVTITVALRVWHNPRWAENGGGPTRESQLGTMDRIGHVAREHAAAQAWSMTAAINLALMELIAAIVSFAMYSLRRSEREYFWFTVVSLGDAFVYLLNFYGATHHVRIYVAWSSYAVDFALRGVAGLFFYRALLRGRTNLLFRISIFAIAPLSAEYLLLLSNSIPPGWWLGTSIVLELPGFIWISLLLLKGLRQRLPDARLLTRSPPYVHRRIFAGTCGMTF